MIRQRSGTGSDLAAAPRRGRRHLRRIRPAAARSAAARSARAGAARSRASGSTRPAASSSACGDCARDRPSATAPRAPQRALSYVPRRHPVRRIDERRLRALHVAQRACPAARAGRRAAPAARCRCRCRARAPALCEPEEGDHVVLVHAVARDADRADQLPAAIDRHAAREDLDAVRPRARARRRCGAHAGGLRARSPTRLHELVDDEVELEADVERAPLRRPASTSGPCGVPSMPSGKNGRARLPIARVLSGDCRR